MRSEKTDNPHDTRLKELFHNKKAFVSFLRDCVQADWIGELDESSLTRKPESYILPDFKNKEVDVLYEGTIKKGKVKVVFYVLLELQSKVDFTMPYRLLLYIVEVLRDYYNQSDVKERKRKGFRFPVVVPLVLYTGKGKFMQVCA